MTSSRPSSRVYYRKLSNWDWRLVNARKSGPVVERAPNVQMLSSTLVSLISPCDLLREDIKSGSANGITMIREHDKGRKNCPFRGHREASPTGNAGK
ncbi:hypothetical protein IFM89_032128 [Coptis chinensis]|uniref:Uncharacterized protein n=1 Tax=Coptis chinensis TaxID=261450 RepID=A0A835IT36_9MAGN|nr:hypothetical protein IFM89_032128 [Coptis chinensis]